MNEMALDESPFASPPMGTNDPRSIARAGTGRRSVGRTGHLPGGRAVVGGLLIMVATVGAVTIARSSGAPDTVATLVAATAIAPGDVLGVENLVAVDLALPDSMATSTFADPASLAGTVSRSHLEPGEVLQRGDVVAATAAQRAVAPARELSMRVDLDRAVDGRLEAGDRVDILATYGSGIDAVTLLVLADVRVLSAARAEGGVASARSLVITLALEQRADTMALAHAVDNASVTVVRTTTSTQEPPGSTPFRPEVRVTEPEPDPS